MLVWDNVGHITNAESKSVKERYILFECFPNLLLSKYVYFFALDVLLSCILSLLKKKKIPAAFKTVVNCSEDDFSDNNLGFSSSMNWHISF